MKVTFRRPCEAKMISKFLFEGLSNSKASTPAVTLTLTTLDVFINDCLGKYCGLGENINSILTDDNYVPESSPMWNDEINLPGYPAGHHLYASVDPATGLLSPKLDLASVESLKKAIREFKSQQANTLIMENVVLRDLLGKISPISLAQMKSHAGQTFNDDRLSLAKIWKLIKASHAKANTTTMIESIQFLTNLQMGSSESYFEYLERSTDLYNSFNSVFKPYLALML